MREHIELIAGRYAGKVQAWDVVNEMVDNDGTYRPIKWVNGIGDGDELVKLAFKYARQYAPHTELYYNDFNAWRPTKRDGIARMVRMLQKEGIRIQVTVISIEPSPDNSEAPFLLKPLIHTIPNGVTPLTFYRMQNNANATNPLGIATK